MPAGEDPSRSPYCNPRQYFFGSNVTGLKSEVNEKSKHFLVDITRPVITVSIRGTVAQARAGRVSPGQGKEGRTGSLGMRREGGGDRQQGGWWAGSTCSAFTSYAGLIDWGIETRRGHAAREGTCRLHITSDTKEHFGEGGVAGVGRRGLILPNSFGIWDTVSSACLRRVSSVEPLPSTVWGTGI